LANAALCKAMEVVLVSRRRWDRKKLMSYLSSDLKMRLVLPLGGVLEAAAINKEPDNIHIPVFELDDLGDFPITGFGSVNMFVISPAFTDFFENHLPWVKKNLGTDVRKWPTAFNFGRIIRNAASHRGCIHILEPNGTPGVWRAYNYSHADHGKEIIGTEFAIAEMLVLMFDMHEELEHHGCPAQPL